jgi:cobyrinic acid a,c-diamide synthase
MHDRLLVAGTHSGCGKTTVTIAILTALQKRGVPLSAFKCGPDYIDPMFHRAVLGLPSHNLDPFFCDGQALRRMLVTYGKELSVIEGVMGYYDGVGPDGNYSSFAVAQKTNTPVVLVIDVAGMYQSAAAVLHGFCHYQERSLIAGVIFNGASEMLYPRLQELANRQGITPLGFLPREKGFSLESRRLGLVAAAEVADVRTRIDRLGALAERTLDLDGIVSLAAAAPPLPEKPFALAAPNPRVRIAIARDDAFCFLYSETLDLFESLGCELCFFSPLRDCDLPERIGGLYLPGGYPELHLKALSENRSMRTAIRRAVADGLPTIAECGGFLYLHDALDGAPMTGVFSAKTERTDRLQRFGYVTLTAQKDTLLCDAGERICAHEFHYYDSEDCGNAFTAEKASGGRGYDCIVAKENLLAGFPHLYLRANESFAIKFVERAAQYAHL